MNNLSKPTKIGVGLLYVFILLNIILSGISLAIPDSGGDFAALSNFVTGLTAALAGGISLILLILSIFLFKQKRWAYITSIILILLLLPILAISDLTGLGFTFIPGSPISLTKEILPLAVVLLFIIGRKDFKKILN